MSFQELAFEEIAKYLERRDTLPGLVDRIRKLSAGRGVAFYPCGRYSHQLIQAVRRADPDLASRIIALVDKSDQARTDTGLPVRALTRLPELDPEIGLVVVAQSYFYTGAVQEVRKIGGFDGEILATSYFDLSLPDQDNRRILADARAVHDLLADDKSRITYLLYWLSRALHDERITCMFEGEEEFPIDGTKTVYKGYTLLDLGASVVKELFAGLYHMRHVAPGPGDVILDIGAYKGDSAIAFADAAGPQGKVYAFEPTRASHMGLVENIRRNGLEKRIVARNTGFSDAPGEMRATTLDTGQPWSFVSEEEGNETVAITTVDRFVVEEKIAKLDYVKMDVEGFESRVIAGARETLARFKPKLAIAFYHQTRDLTELPLMLARIADYRFYVRSKQEGPFGITLFAKRA